MVFFVHSEDVCAHRSPGSAAGEEGLCRSHNTEQTQVPQRPVSEHDPADLPTAEGL